MTEVSTTLVLMHPTDSSGATLQKLFLGVSFRATAFSMFFMNLSCGDWRVHGGACTVASSFQCVLACGAVTIHITMPVTLEMGRAVEVLALLKATNVFSSGRCLENLRVEFSHVLSPLRIC